MSTKNSNLYTFLSLFFVLIIDMMGVGLILPVLAPLFTSTEISMLPAGTSVPMRDFYYGLSMAIFFIFSFFGGPFMGDWSDNVGRRKVIFTCLIGVALGFFISALGILFKSVFWLIVGRAVDGFAAGSQTIAQAAIIDISTKSNKVRNLGLITLASCIGFVIGPIVGGYFSQNFLSGLSGYSLPFFIAGGLALLNAGGVLLTFKETYVPAVQRKFDLIKGLTSLRLAFVSPDFRMLSVIFLLMQAAWSIYFQFISLFLAQEYHYDAMTIGLFMAGIGLVFSLSFTVLINLFMRAMKLKALILVSFALIILAFVAAVVFHRYQWIQWVIMVPAAMGIAFCYTGFLTLFSNRADKDSQGLVMGVSNSIAAIAWCITGLLMGALTSMGVKAPFLISALCIGIAFYLMTKEK